MEIKNAHIDSSIICGHNFSELVGNTIVSNREEQPIIRADKSFTGNVTFGNVVVHGRLFGIKNMEALQNYLKFNQQNIEVTADSIEFPHELHVDDLVFGHSINMMSVEEFGNQWLLSELDQVTNQ